MRTFELVNDDAYPVTIIAVRYGGIYEGGAWAAFPVRSESIPPDVMGDDVTCATWWETHGTTVGTGDNPNAALADLRAKIAAGQHFRATV